MADYQYRGVFTNKDEIIELFRYDGKTYEEMSYATGEWKESDNAMDAFHHYGDYEVNWPVSEERALEEERSAKDYAVETMCEKAMKLFLANKTWKEYYETAPSEACRQYIRLEFCYSAYLGPEDINERSARWEEQFTVEDWKHLARYAGNNPFRGKCRRKIRELTGED